MSLLGPQLEAFTAIARHKTVHGAAAAIHLTQTAVTQRIRVLERLLKTTLFLRTRRGMLLTTEGEALLRYCQATQELAGAALAKIQGAGIESDITVSISAPSSLMHSRIIPSCLTIMKKFPRLLMRFDVNDSTNRQQTLRTGECDFALIDEEQLIPEMEYKKLRPEEYVLVCSSQWENRSLKEIMTNECIIDFDPTDQMTFNYLKKYHLFQYINHRRHFINRTEDLALLIVKGIGYGILAKEFVQPYINNQQLILLNKSKTLNVTPCLVWYERHEAPAYFAAIINAIVSIHLTHL